MVLGCLVSKTSESPDPDLQFVTLPLEAQGTGDPRKDVETQSCMQICTLQSTKVVGTQVG